MTAPPQVITRALTFRFARSVSLTTGQPDVMEVAILPLDPASIGGQATYAGGLKVATVELSDPVNTVSFDLIPTYSPGLTAPIEYRVMWRAGLTGRTYTYDFSMPDQDLDWDDLAAGPGNIITGEAYLQQSDLGVPGRVARLNEMGAVVDALGNSVATGDDMALLRSDLTVEILNRTKADLAQRSALEDELAAQIDATLTTAQAYVDTKTANTHNEVLAEANARASGDASLHSQIEAATAALQGQIGDLTATSVGAIPVGSPIDMEQVTGLPGALAAKTSVETTTGLQNQVTALANDATVVHTVASLIPNVLMPANIALVNAQGNITTKGGTVVALGTGASVTSINGKTGAVTQNLSDIAAIGGSVPPAQVDGLVASLAGKASINDTRLTDARTPTAHAASHGLGQGDALTLAPAQVTGLAGIISNNGLTGTSAHEGRIAALESGAGGNGGTPAKSLWFNEATDHTGISSPADFQAAGVALRGPWSIDGGGLYSYYTEGVPPPGESYLYPYVTPNGHLELREWNEANPPDPTYATTTQLATKADSSTVSALITTVGTKANSSDLTTLAGRVSTVESTLPAKADLVGGRVPNTQTSQTIPLGYVAGLTAYLAHLNASTGAFDAAYLTNWAGVADNAIAATKVAGLAAALPTKADLSGGYLATAQIPPQVISNAVQVANKAAMLALSPTVAHQGTLCKITATSDIGTYFLTTSDPSNFANWMLITTGGGTGTITSVNGYYGPDVVLDYSDVGAMAANAMMGINQVTGLQTALDGKATTSALTTGLAGKTSPTDVQNMFTLSSFTKRADYVATVAVASRAGQQSADGVLMPVGAIVLLTAQSSSVDNGLWVVASSTWSRPANFATGSYLAKDSLVIVGNATGSANGTANNATIWQETAVSGFIDSNANNWTRIGYTTIPMAPVEGNGISITGTYPAKTFAAKTVAGGGVLATVNGLSVDRNLTPGKYLGTVPSGNPIAGITHNLNTTSPAVFIYEVASNNLVLAGVTVTSANAISIEFASAPATNQYRVAVYG